MQRVATVSHNAKIDAVAQLGISTSLDTTIEHENLMYLLETIIDETDSGVPMNQILSSIAKTHNTDNFSFWRSSKNKKFAAIVGHLCTSIERGHTFAEAVNQFPKAFPEHFRALILAAETSGRWVTNKNGETEDIGILNLMVKQLDRENKVRSKVKGAMLYPTFILGAIALAVAILAFAVLPKMREFFQALDLEKNMNFATKTMLMAGDLINSYYSLVPIVIVLAILGTVLFWRSYGKTLWQKYQFSLPLIGQTVRNIKVAEIFCLFSTLQDAGITAEKSLQILAKVCDNQFLQNAINEARNKVLGGAPFAESLGKSHEVFADREYNVLASAEKAGTLSSRPLKHAEKLFYKAEQEIDKLIGLIQPIMLVLVGIVVGFIVIGFYGAFFGAIGQLSSH